MSTPAPSVRASLVLAAVLAVAALLRPAPAAAPALASATPISSLPYTIGASGTYCVTANLTGVANQHGITVNADNVVIDLGGHVLQGVADSLSGVNAFAVNVTVKNGAVQGWGGHGVQVGKHGAVERVFARENGDIGIRASDWSVVSHCSASLNGNAEILVAEGGVVRDCAVSALANGVIVGSSAIAERVAVSDGGISFLVSSGARLVSCSARDFREFGFYCDKGVTLVDCGTTDVDTLASPPGTAVYGTSSMVIEGCNFIGLLTTGIVVDNGARISRTSISGVLENGIQVGASSRVTECFVEALGTGVIGGRGSVVADSTVRAGTTGIALEERFGCVIDNVVLDGADAGIRVAGEALVRGNLAAANGFGLVVAGDRGRIEGNTLSANKSGLTVNGAHNLVTGNRAAGGPGADFTIPFTNTFGPALNATGPLQGAIPHANFRAPL